MFHPRQKVLRRTQGLRCSCLPNDAVHLPPLTFNTTDESWLNQQVQGDLWYAGRNRKNLHVRKLVAA
jgi:hypothetical protein